MISHLAEAAERSVDGQREQVFHQLLEDLRQVNYPLLLHLQAEQDLDGDTERQRPGGAVNIDGARL